MSHPHKRRGLVASIAALLALVVALGLAVFAQNTTASAHPRQVATVHHTVVTTAETQALAAQSNNCHGSVSNGPGIMTSGYDNVGVMLFCGKAWICFSPYKGLNRSQSWKQIARLTGTTTEVSRQIWYLLYEYIPWIMQNRTSHPTAANHTAASLRIAVNKLIGKTANRRALAKWKAQVPAAVYTRGMSTMPKLAAKYHGPYTLKQSLSRALHPAGTTSYCVTLVAAHGADVPGKLTTFSVTGGTVSRKQATTNSGGRACVTVTATKVGWVYMHATVHGLASVYGLLSLPADSTQQQLLSQAPGTHKSATKKANSTFPRVKLTVQCPANCQPTHVPVIGSSIPNPTGHTWYATLTGERVVNGKTVTVDYGKKAIRPHTTLKAPTWHASNGDKHLKVTLSVSFSGHTIHQVVGTLSLVQCQPELPVGVEQDFSCACDHVVIKSGVNQASSTITVAYSDSAGNHATFQVAPGQSVPPTTEKVSGGHLSWTIKVTTPNATPQGTRTVTITGTTTVTVA